MNIAKALDYLWLIGANDHVSNEDGSYLHPMTGPGGCETCFALEEVRKLIESLGKPAQVRMNEDIEAAIDVPQAVELEPLTLPMDIEGETFLGAEWDIDELRLSMTRRAPGLELCVTGALELDGLVELRDKMINPAIEHHEARQRAEANEAERRRAEHAARAEERAREEAERDRAQSFRGVSVQRTITGNVTVHGRVCASLASARKHQTLGTVIFAWTPEDLIRRLPSAFDGKLNMRFCAKCKPVPNAQLHNAYLNGGLPLNESIESFKARITGDVWEGHHAALEKYDNEKGN